MNLITTFISAAIDAGKRKLKVNGLGTYDPRPARECAPFGLDSNPVKGMQAIYAETLTSGEQVVIGYINTAQLAETGGTRLFSTNTSGAVQIALYLRANGTMEIGGSANHMTQYEALKTAFDELRGDLNDLVSKFNSHTHVLTLSAGTGSAAPTTPSASPSAADMSGAKLDNIKTQ